MLSPQLKLPTDARPREEKTPDSDKPIERPRPDRVLGMRKSALIEMALFFLVALVLDALATGGTRFWGTAPHPFWIVVILMTVQYGTTEGLVACAVATAALLMNNLPEQSLSQDFYDYVFTLTSRPLMWFVAAVILGELRMRQIRERDELRRNLDQTVKRENTVAAAYDRMRTLKRDLEVKVAGQMNTFITLFKAARAMDKLQPDDVLLGVNEIVRTLMHPKRFSVFLLERDRLETSIQNGWSADDIFERTFASSHPIFREVISNQHILCAANADDEKILGREGLLAGPLIDVDSGKVFGMLKIEELGFLDFNLASIHTFKVLSEWIATTYRNALRFEAVRAASVVNEDTQMFSYGFFSRQKNFLLGIARRIGFDLSMVIVKLRDIENLSEPEAKKVATILSGVVQGVLRKTDLACDYQQTGYEFAVVLPGTPVEDAPIVADKISVGLQEELDRESLRATISLTVQTLHKQEQDRRLVTRDEFIARLEFLSKLEERVSFEMSMLVFSLTRFDALDDSARGKASDILRGKVMQFLQENETCFAYQRSISEVVLLVPVAEDSETMKMAGRLKARLRRALGDLNVGASSTIQTLPTKRSGEVLDVRTA